MKSDHSFSPNTGKYGPEKTPYLGAFHAVIRNIFRETNVRNDDPKQGLQQTADVLLIILSPLRVIMVERVVLEII